MDILMSSTLLGIPNPKVNKKDAHQHHEGTHHGPRPYWLL